MTPGQILQAKERAAAEYRSRLAREMLSAGVKRHSDHVDGFKNGWDAAIAFLRQPEPD